MKGLGVTRRGTQINYILFADDCVLFKKAFKDEWLKMQDTLNIYEKRIAKVLNKDKSSIMFSPRTMLKDKNQVIQAIGGTICSSYEKYLKLPAMIGKLKYNTLRNIKKKVWKQINSLKNNFLSQIGHKILVKVVL